MRKIINESLLAIGLNMEPMLWQNAVLTAVAELPLFCLLGYRGYKLSLCFGAANIVSNILFNEILVAADSSSFDIMMFVGEALVVMTEFCLMRVLVQNNFAKLFYTLCITNFFSWALGMLISL